MAVLPRPAGFLSRLARRPSSDAQVLFKQGGLTFVSLVASAAAGFFYLYVLSHSMRPGPAGSVVEGTTLFAICGLVATAGADLGLMRLMSARPLYTVRTRRQLAMVVLAPPLLLSLGLMTALLLWGRVLGGAVGSVTVERERLGGVLLLLVPALPFGAVSTIFLNGLRGVRLRSCLVVQYGIVPLGRLSGLLALKAVVRMTPAEAAIAWIAPVLLGVVASLLIVRSALAHPVEGAAPDEQAPDSVRWLALVRDFWGFAIPRSVELVLLTLITGLDVVFVAALSSQHNAALYAVDSRYATLSTFGLQALAFAIMPQVARLVHHNQQAALRRLYEASVAISIIVCWPLILTVGMYSRVAVGLFGSAYRGAAVPLVVLCVGCMISAATGPVGAVLVMSGRSTVNLMCTLLAVLANIGVDLWLIPRGGVLGAALGWTTSMLVCNAAQVFAIGARLRSAIFSAAVARFVGIVTIAVLPVETVGLLTFGSTPASLGLALPAACVLLALGLLWSRGRVRVSLFDQQLIEGGV